jgi:hypothetical protein
MRKLLLIIPVAFLLTFAATALVWVPEANACIRDNPPCYCQYATCVANCSLPELCISGGNGWCCVD